MKKTIFYTLFLCISAALFLSCNHDKKVAIAPKFTIKIDTLSNKNAPALQSFAHGIHNGSWLLFAGRTNKVDDNGGIHDMTKKSDYAQESFPPTSYNENIYVYNPTTDSIPKYVSIDDMIAAIAENFSTYNIDTITKYKTVFKNTNALVKQVDEFLYVIGGYGALDFENPKKGYTTYNHIAQIHIPSMMAFVQGEYAKVDTSKFLAFTQNKNLISTGGELHYINGTFYVVGGHNFGTSSPSFSQGQKYLDAVYPFSVNSNSGLSLNISVSAPISDVSDPTGTSADVTSIFRRRDGPITPSLYFNALEQKLEESISIYAGVFKPGEDLQAWNDAIYIHPNWSNSNNKLYTYDKNYNQKNFNVYSCPNVVAYDEHSKILHTFLLGGIGDGNTSKEIRLSGFTNTGTHIKLYADKSPLQSSNSTFSQNLFGVGNENTKPFYGAEAIFFASSNFKSTAISKDIIDLKSSFPDNSGSIEIGYIFGGIEAFDSHPGTYGVTKSRASKKIWKVTLEKQF